MAGGSALLGCGLALLAIAQTLSIFLAAWVVIGTGMGAGLYDAVAQ
jgi:hypothetical protein